jgi:hypothetical protein
MDKSLYWEPCKESVEISDVVLKKILVDRWKIDRSYSVLRESDLSYLQGLLDAGVEGVEDLIEAICIYKEIRIYTEGSIKC